MKLTSEQLGRTPKSASIFILYILAIVVLYSLMSTLGQYALDNWQPLINFTSKAPANLFIVFATAVLIHIVLFPWVRIVHGRKYSSLALPDGRLNFRHIQMANIAAVLLFIFVEPIYLALNWTNISSNIYGFTPQWLMWIIPFVLIIFVQVCAEEMFFRGYLQQYIAHYTRHRWIYIGIPAILWTLPHWTNIKGVHLQITFLVFIFTLAIVLGLIADRTKSLAFPIGLHFFFNLFTVCIYGSSFRPSSMLLIKTDYSAVAIPMQASYYILTSCVLIFIYFLLKKRI